MVNSLNWGFLNWYKDQKQIISINQVSEGRKNVRFLKHCSKKESKPLIHYRPAVHTACHPYCQGFDSASPSDTSGGLEDHSSALDKSLLAAVQAQWGALAAGNRDWVLHMAGHASSLPGPLGLEASGYTYWISMYQRAKTWTTQRGTCNTVTVCMPTG